MLKAGRGAAVGFPALGRDLLFLEADDTGFPWFSLVVGCGSGVMAPGRLEGPGEDRLERPDGLVALGTARQLGLESMGAAKLTRPMPLTDRAMRAQPASNRALRPARSTSPMAIRVATTFTAPSPTEASTAEEPARKPTEWKIVEA